MWRMGGRTGLLACLYWTGQEACPTLLRRVRGRSAGCPDGDQAAPFGLGGSQAAFQAASALPPLRAVAPDLANRRGLDIAHGGHSEARQHIAVGHHLYGSEGGAN